MRKLVQFEAAKISISLKYKQKNAKKIMLRKTFFIPLLTPFYAIIKL